MFVQRFTLNKSDYTMKKKSFLMNLVLAAGLLCPAGFQALAQAPGGGGGGGGMGGFLTQDQRTKLRESMQASRTEVAPLMEKLAEAQKDALKALMAKDGDEKAVRAKLEAVSKIQTDITMLRLKAVKEVAATLTDEQKTQINERPAMAYMMLLGGGGGMGGGMGGGQRGGGGPGGGRGGGGGGGGNQ